MSSCSGPANRPPLRTRAGVFAAAVKKPPAALGFCMRSGLLLATMLASSSLAAETPRTIDQLLAQGWEIAGYASGYDNRTSLILFRHPGINALVQCGILYDVNARSAHSRQLLRAAVGRGQIDGRPIRIYSAAILLPALWLETSRTVPAALRPFFGYAAPSQSLIGANSAAFLILQSSTTTIASV
jgi:hypothetical protein